MTPLMFAAGDGSEDLVQLFLDKGADVNAKTPSGFTALSMAKSAESEAHRDVIRKLQAAGGEGVRTPLDALGHSWFGGHHVGTFKPAKSCE